jgi:phosphate-selective porin OprO/OprP
MPRALIRSQLLRLPTLAFVVSTWCFAGPAFAAPPDAAGDDGPSVQSKVDEISNQIRRLERQLAELRADNGRGTVTPNGGDAVNGSATLSLDAIESRLDELDQQIRVVARQAEIDREALAEKAKTAPIVGAGKDGFLLKSADGSFQLKLRGYAQADGRYFADGGGPLAPDTFLLRRVRPIVDGTLFKNFDFRIMPDFGGGTTSLQDAYVDLKFHPAFKVRAGKFKGPIGLERLVSGSELPFIERALPTALVPNRDVGVVIFGDVLKSSVNYTLGIQNGVVDGASLDVDDRDGKDIVARVFVLPFKNGGPDGLKQLGFGLAGSSGTQRGTLTSPNLPVYRTSGQAIFARYRLDAASGAGTTIADGSHWRVSPQGYYYAGPFGLLGEYVFSSQKVRRDITAGDLGSSAWQVLGSWVVTGEDSSYRGVNPRSIFDPSNRTWGALELTARVNALALDRDAFPVFANPAVAARTATAWGLGTNWYLNRAVKISVDFEETRFDGGASDGDRPTERNVLTRFQVGY